MFEEIKMRMFFKKDIIVKGKIIEEPVLTFNMSMNASSALTFPLLIEEIVHIPDGLDKIPFQVGDEIMISSSNKAYMHAGHELEIYGLIFIINHNLLDKSNIIIKAKKIYNITRDFSFDY